MNMTNAETPPPPVSLPATPVRCEPSPPVETKVVKKTRKPSIAYLKKVVGKIHSRLSAVAEQEEELKKKRHDLHLSVDQKIDAEEAVLKQETNDLAKGLTEAERTLKQSEEEKEAKDKKKEERRVAVLQNRESRLQRLQAKAEAETDPMRKKQRLYYIAKREQILQKGTAKKGLNIKSVLKNLNISE